MQKTQKINFSEIGIKQHEKKYEKKIRKIWKFSPPDPPFDFKRYLKVFKKYH